MKRKPTRENVFEIEPYRSILNLLVQFQHHKGGLEQRHFRYALCKNHDVENFHKTTILEMVGFFGIQLNKLYDDRTIKEGCVTSRNAMNNFLHTLSDLDVIIIEQYTPEGEKRKRDIYEIHPDFYKTGIKLQNKEIINRYDWGDFQHYELKDTRFILYGISEHDYNLLSSEEKKEIEEHINKIEESSIKIEEIKGRNYLRHWKLLMRGFHLNPKKDKRFRRFIDEASNFLAYKFEIDCLELKPEEVDKIMDKYFSHIPEFKNHIEAFNEEWVQNEFGFNEEDTRDFFEFCRVNMKRILEETWDGIVISRFRTKDYHPIESLFKI